MQSWHSLALGHKSEGSPQLIKKSQGKKYQLTISAKGLSILMLVINCTVVEVMTLDEM